MQSLSSFFTSTLTAPTSAPSFLRRPIPIQTPTTAISATLIVGDKLPKATFSYLNDIGEVKTTTVSDLIKGKNTILFAIPGAFTPTCSQNHVLGFLEKSTKLKAMGVDAIACVSVNHAFVMRVWKNDLKVSDEVLLLSDGIGTLMLAIGCELDL